jgi:hypothetical protein
VFVYSDTDELYFQLSNQPPSHPACNPVLFSIDPSTPAERRKLLLSRLLLAKASQETITIGFDDQGNCSNGYIRVHRVG